MLKWRSSSAASFVDEGPLSPAAAVDANNPENEDGDWDLEGAVILDGIKPVDAKRCLRDIYDKFRAKERKITGTIAERFELATELVDQVAPADASPSTELISVEVSLAIVQAEAIKVKYQLLPLQQNHDTLEAGKDLTRVRRTGRRR